MKLMEDVYLTDSVEIQKSPENIFKFLSDLKDGESYRAWHPDDHVTMRWIKGPPWQEGSTVYAEEYVGGKLYKLTFVVTKVVPHKKIEYVPVSWIHKRYAPKYAFSIKPKSDSSIFTATVHVRVPLIPRLLARKSVERNLASVEKHMKEEGENMKKLLEAGE